MTEKEIVIVTTYKREELLYLCLEAIDSDEPGMPVVVFSDRNAESRELNETCELFKALPVVRVLNRGYGNSWNLLDAARMITKGMSDLSIVHLIEDDTLVHRGYFAWARQQLGGEKFAAVCGRIGSPHITNWYESPCASWNAAYLRIALSHAIPEYFSETREEMLKVLDEKIFPDSKYRKGGAEQDGFFLRCIEHYGWKTRFPDKPLATHLGWYGYNSPPMRERPKGAFADRVAACRALLANKQLRKELFGARITELEMEGMR